MHVISMPQLGETVTEGTITTWSKAVGDAVAIDDALFEVSTEKVDTEVPSAVAGFLRVVLVAEGETVPIGTAVAVVTATADEPFDPPEDAAPVVADAPAAREPRPTPPPPPAVDPPGEAEWGAVRSPVVRRLLAEHELDPADVAGSGRDGRITRQDVLAAAAQRDRRPPVEPAAPGEARALAPPGAAPAHTPGEAEAVGVRSTGEARALAPPGAAPAHTPGEAEAGAAEVELGPDHEVVPLSRARLATAEHMTRSLATAAHAMVAVEVDWSNVEPVRRAAGLSYLPFAARAVVDALADHPHVNASFAGDHLVVHATVHLGVAVDVGHEALVVPVVRDAQDLRLHPLADAVADLADRARRRRLAGHELAGATFSLTNVGSYGTVVTTPIIDQPQVAILSTDGVRMAPVAVRTDPPPPPGAPPTPPHERSWGVAIHPVGNLSLSFDHRAFDGAYAASFLARVRDVLQERDWWAEVGR
ncbi:MAG: 2-oxo acid dehydrogenase subunit E2 [Actinobacteria bacterium]|nr:2-oxo acid dehydrogenase subunit E2 [Actinomycetota bacterium]